MTGNKPVLDLRRPDMDALHVDDLIVAIGALATWLAYLIVMTQARDQLALELAARVQIDGVIDGLVGDSFGGVVGPHIFEPASNLLGRPA